jgi:hypothetical protein
MDTVYIHYGASNYEPQRFTTILNTLLGVKPEGGLWATPENADYGWKEWCESNEFNMDRLNKHFKFKLSQQANILQINCVEDLKSLPKAEPPQIGGAKLPSSIMSWVLLDFEKLLQNGVDAIQVNISNDTALEFDDKLYYALYGWDCDSILVMNKDVIEVIG